MSVLFKALPRQTSKILSMVEEQKIAVNVNLIGLEEFQKKLDSFTACIALAVISAGLGVASSLVIQAKIAPLLFGVSLLGVFGYLMAVVLGIWVVYLITRKAK